MLEEQGRKLFASLYKGFARFLGRHTLSIGKGLEQKIIHHFSETGRKSVKNLVRKGRDLELSATISSREQLREICKQCKKQNIAFAIKTEGTNQYRIVYQRKDSALLSDNIDKVIEKQLKPKRSLREILKSNNQIKRQQQSINSPVKHREVNAR